LKTTGYQTYKRSEESQYNVHIGGNTAERIFGLKKQEILASPSATGATNSYC